MIKQPDLIKITRMEEQLKNVVKTLESVCPKIDKMHETFLKGEGKIQKNRDNLYELNKTVNGNGKVGVVEKIQLVEKRIAYYAGGLVVVVAVIQLIIGVLL